MTTCFSKAFFSLWLLGWSINPATAANVYVRDFSPQGEVREPNRAVVMFSADVVKLGETDVPAPYAASCPVSGLSRWSSPNTWTYTLSRKLASGEKCSFTLKPQFKGDKGIRISGQSHFEFFTPGPWITRIQPTRNARIEENQAFLIQTSVAVKQTSVEQFAYCEAEGVGERIAVKFLPAADFQRLKNALNDSQFNLGVQCARPLPPGAKVSLVWGRGIASENDAILQENDTVAYEVRPVFRAELTCERGKPNRPCSPLSDIRLLFSENVSRALAEKILLKSAKAERKPFEDSPATKAAILAAGRKLLVLRYQDGQQDSVSEVVFKGPFAADTSYTITLPPEFKDLSGRSLSNAASFPLKTRVAGYPPLAKFAADFGILELKEGGILPVTLRNVEAKLRLRVLRQSDGASMINTMNALEKFEQQTAPIVDKPKAKLTRRTLDANEETPMEPAQDVNYPRELSYLASNPAAPAITMPKSNGSRAFEVMGIPLSKPGFYVVEITSTQLGSALLKHPKPMYVRSQALVTDMAVHLKKGRDNSLVWVTSLSSGKPVAKAEVQIFGCNGAVLQHGVTDKQGVALFEVQLAQRGKCTGDDIYFATAKLGEDFSFVRSDWINGIEPWRFSVDTWSSIQSPKIHTILDRSLLRAGETVSMKHIARIPQVHGFSYPKAADLPKTMTIALQGGDTSITLPLTWDARGTATSQWQIPETAKLGEYVIQMGATEDYDSSSFRVSEFRLPAFKGSIMPETPRLAHVKAVPLRLSLAYLNGGGAANQEVEVSALMSSSYLHFPQYREFNFGINRGWWGSRYHELVADKQKIKLDAQGGAKVTIPLSGYADEPTHMQAEMSFNDPNGETQTIAGSAEIWPANIAVGAQVLDWASLRGKRKIVAVALGLDGKPQAYVPVTISGTREWSLVHRKRILGGFYSYEEVPQSQDLGEVCRGKTNALGLMQCEVDIREGGYVRLHVLGQDKQGNASQADTGFYSSNNDIWFTQEDQDRMEVIPERREYEVGDTAKLQVHTPFNTSTALVSVEREGIVQHFVQILHRGDAVIKIPVGENWGPNVVVSVLAVRGRIVEVPWYSFFDWGWRSPGAWWQAMRTGVPQATAMVDLARPSFKFGMTRLDIGRKGNALNVTVTTDKAVYQPRAKVQVDIQVQRPNGKPVAAGTEVTVAAVDRALLELSPNPSWKLLEAMMQERAYLVETSTAQMQVIGKRHFGKKALPAGGGGGAQTSRELFDTLLYWNPRVKLDANGRAKISVPLNDSMTAFKIVAIADAETGLFGSGEAEITSTQEVQITSSLPPLVREGDHYRAWVSVRNATKSEMKLTLRGNAGKQTLSPQSISLAAGGATEVAWNLSVPNDVEKLAWQIDAVDSDGKSRDSIKLVQKVQPKVPVTVQQASFMQLTAPYSVETVLPQGALPGKGGVEVHLTAKLSQQTAGIRSYFENYPYSCLEQKISIATGLQDGKRWDEISHNLDGYLDAKGFAQFFPGMGAGSEALTGYVLTMAHLSQQSLPSETEDKMQKALLDFAEGRIKSSASWFWGEREYLPERRLSALAALAYSGKVQGRMLQAYEFKPIKMATTTVIDWYALLKRVADAPDRNNRLKAIERELRNRMSYVGGRLVFTTEKNDHWWWLMTDGEINAVRLLQLAMDDAVWQADLPALMRGAMLRQTQGHWQTTMANSWGSVALREFGQRFEHAEVTGVTTASLEVAGDASTSPSQNQNQNQNRAQYRWTNVAISKQTPPAQIKPGQDSTQLNLNWPKQSASFKLNHQGSGQPWVSIFVKAALPGKTVASGYSVQRSISPIKQAVAGVWSRGDLVRVRLDIDASVAMSWVALSDPIPGGASILGNTARDSGIDQQGENHYDGKNNAWPSYTERGLGFFRAYFDYVPQGHFWYEYTLRLNNPGEFSLPATRVEAMYAPELFGQLINGNLKVENLLPVQTANQ
ncbi:MAG: MG2 domain-containing protein [Methylophilaceae bacterium]